MALTKEFNQAKFYSCVDPETLSHEDIDEALLEMVENEMEKDESLEDTIKRICPIEVTAYKPKDIDPAFVSGQVDYMLETFAENMAEEYGDFDGNWGVFDHERQAWIEKVLHANLMKALRNTDAWQCETAGTHKFSAEEVQKLLG